MQGLRHLLLGEGLERDAIDAGLARWCSVFSERYVPLLERTPTPHWQAAPRVVETLDELARSHELALLTGNPEPVARARMRRLGLDRFFAAGTGAFGCEAEERAELVQLARRRAGDLPLAEIVLVGDTPRDVAGAHEAGIRAIAVATGEYGPTELADADHVLGALSELPNALR
jgi:phosphoglycolate phosphatase